MAEQLSMDFNADKGTAEYTVADTDNIVTEEYEALDYQLAELFQELNVFEGDEYEHDKAQKKAQNKAIKHCTLEISKHTREGQIAIPCTEEHQVLLLQSNVGGMDGDYKPLIIDQGYLYLRRYYLYQKFLAERIQARMLAPLEQSDSQQIQARLDHYFETEENETNWQKRAAELALENQFLIISGGPGTGKTTTITRLLALLIEQHLFKKIDEIPKVPISGGGVFPNTFKILLAAPTGKAAIRMLASIHEIQSQMALPQEIAVCMPSEASTIHKLLGYQQDRVQFKHNASNPLNADVVLVDEASMIDVALMSKLVEAVPEHARLILIGDKDQLSSVETGSVFADICEALADSNYLVTLKKNWRFAADSDIGQCALAANQGNSEQLLQILNDPNRNHCELLSAESLSDVDLIKPWQHYFEVLNNPTSTLPEIFAAFNQYRILCALRRGYPGSERMNDRIENALQKQDLIRRRRNTKQQLSHWYNGRPIMITKNSYNKGLFNGDTGITLIRDGEIKVWFPSGTLLTDGSAEFKSFSPVRLPNHETTWSMTIHKSQGSEFNQVVMVLPQEEIPLLTRQLVYTGITRAKEKMSIVASVDVLVAGVKADIVEATRIASLDSLKVK